MTRDKKPAVAKNLFALRKAEGLTQQEIADMIGVTNVTYNCWERGRTTPRRKALELVASTFGVTDDDLLSEKNGLYARAYGLISLPDEALPATATATRAIPVLGAAHAGDPDEPWEFDGEAMLPECLARKHPLCYALRVNGSCMDKVFTEHDHIFVDPEMEPRDGSISVMLIDGRSEVRRVKLGSGSMMLVSESHSPRADIIIREGDGQEAVCQGVVFWWQARSESP